MSETVSWWVLARTRQAFVRQAVAEGPRMRGSKFGGSAAHDGISLHRETRAQRDARRGYQDEEITDA